MELNAMLKRASAVSPLILLSMILFASSPLMAQPAATRSQTIKAGGQLAQAYVDKKLTDYRQRTHTLEALLNLMGGAMPAAKTSFNLPEPEQIRVTARRKPYADTKEDILKDLSGKNFFVITKVDVGQDPVIAADGLTARAYGLHQHVYVYVKGRIYKVAHKTCRFRRFKYDSSKRWDQRWVEVGNTGASYDEITSSRDVDLTGLLTSGKGGARSIGIVGLKGSNLEFDGVGLKALSEGELHAPVSLHWKVPKWEKSRLPSENEYIQYSPVGNCGAFMRLGKLVDTEFPRKGVKLFAREIFPHHAVKIKKTELKSSGNRDIFYAWNSQTTGGAGLSYHTNLDWPALKEARIRHLADGALNASVSGNGPFTVSTKNGTVIVRDEGVWPGANSITASLGDTHSHAQSVTLTANKVGRLMIDAPLLMQDQGMKSSLAIGTKYNVRMRVTGPANMSRYHVKWEMRTASGKLNGIKMHKSEFKRDGKGWVASARVRLPDALWDKQEAELGKVGKRLGTLGRTSGVSGSISATIISPEGYDVYRTHRGNVLAFDTASPGVTYLELLGGYSGGDVKSHTDSDPLDVFIGSQVGPMLSAEVDIQRKKGVQRKRVNLPVGWIRVQRDSGGALGQSRGRIMATGGKPGKAKVRAVIRRADADKAHIGVFFSKGRDSMQSEPLVLSINRPYLIKENNGARYTLMVDGPAKMSRYHAKWSVRVHGKLKTFVKGFLVRPGQSQRSSSIDLASLAGIKQKAFRSGAVAAFVNHVEILNKANQAVARLVVGGGMPVIAPNITLHAVGGAFVQGMEGKITANITNLPASLAKRSVVQWSFGGVLPVARGKANGKSMTYYKKHDESRLRLAKDGFSSSIVVSYPEDPATAGKIPGVRAELVLKAGKK